MAANRSGQLSAKQMDKLPPNQRKWSDNVLRALKLKSKGSQARVLAGALATTSQIEQSSPTEAQAARQLLKTVQAAGDPPWKDTKKAMAATEAAMKLDLLSIPQNNRHLNTLGGGGVNETYTVDRLDADGQSRPAFLCKSATSQKLGWQLDDKVDGIPDGGEVIREAMSSRAAQTFAAQTGIDIGMPESHVVQLPAALVPGSQPGDPDVTCSIQEWGPGLTKLKELPGPVRNQVQPAQVAALAVFDLMTLNTDRHGGNIMCDAQGRMLPIDHGCSFPQGDAGIRRINETFAGPHNALLRMPEAFEPMPPAMVKGLKSLKSSDYRAALGKDRDDITAVHPSMDRQSFQGPPHPDQGTPAGVDTLRVVSDQALDWAGKAARFAKLAARNQPPLSAGAMQMAFGANAQALLGAADFDAAAKAVIAAAAPHNETVKAVCTSDDAEYAELCRKVRALGWRPQPRGGAPSQGAISDPLVLMSIVANNMRRNTTPPTTLDQVRANVPAPGTMKTQLLTLRKDLIAKFIALMPAAARAAQTAALNALAGPPDQQMATSDGLKITCRDAALAEQTRLMQVKIGNGVSGATKAANDAREAAIDLDPIQMQAEIALMV